MCFYNCKRGKEIPTVCDRHIGLVHHFVLFQGKNNGGGYFFFGYDVLSLEWEYGIMKKNIRIKERRDDMKIEEGSVIMVHENGLAEVKVGRHSDCIACGACPGSDNIVVMVVDPIGVKVGQQVKFEMREMNVIMGAFVCFILPLLLIGLGAIGGYYYGLSTGVEEVHFAVFGGIVGLVIGVVLMKWFDRTFRTDDTIKPKIIEICE